MMNDKPEANEVINRQLIGEIKKNANDKIVIALGEFKGHRFLDVRIHSKQDNGSFHPTKKGVAVHPRLVPQLMELLEKANATCSRDIEGVPESLSEPNF